MDENKPTRKESLTVLKAAAKELNRLMDCGQDELGGSYKDVIAAAVCLELVTDDIDGIMFSGADVFKGDDDVDSDS